jgi:hypothetical protein
MISISIEDEMPDGNIVSPPSRRFWELLGTLCVVLLTVLLFCALAEAGLRIFYRRSLDFSMEMWKYAVVLKHPVANPQLSFSHAPNRSAFLMGVPVSINSYGLRDREYSVEKPPNVYRIVMLGDSTTLGWGVPEEQTVAKILERELNTASCPGLSEWQHDHSKVRCCRTPRMGTSGLLKIAQAALMSWTT